MIDIERDIFDDVAHAIYAEFPSAYVSAEYVLTPPKFPAISIEQTNSVEDRTRIDSSGEENANALTYDVNIYSNSESIAKNECKDLLQIIDTAMRANNFTRTMSMFLDNAADPSIYRMTARFTGLVDKNLVQYRR